MTDDVTRAPGVTDPPPVDRLGDWLGQTDIYLLDQILKGRISPGARVLDAGCGRGRNLVYLLRAGVEVHGVDADPRATEAARALAARLAPAAPAGRFGVAAVEALPFADVAFDVVILSAVLHFARDESHFRAMTDEAWRVLRPGGVWFARLASDVGVEGRVHPLGGRRFALPDGTERFLVDEAMLVDATARLGGVLLDPLKTTVVQGMRAMTTWVARREAGPSSTSAG